MTEVEYLDKISAEPLPEEIRQNKDGSFYIPISAVENKLDKIFYGKWSWEFQREQFGKNSVCGCGRMILIHPATGEFLYKTGTAGIDLANGMKLDYPKLEAMCILNAAKKIGKFFGRDLNRDRDDAPADTPSQNTGTDEIDTATKEKVIPAGLQEILKKQ